MDISINSAVDGVNNKLAIQPNNNFAEKGAKVSARFVVQASLAIAALAKTVAAATLTTFAALIYPFTSKPMNYFMETTIESDQLFGKAIDSAFGRYVYPQETEASTGKIKTIALYSLAAASVLAIGYLVELPL